MNLVKNILQRFSNWSVWGLKTGDLSWGLFSPKLRLQVLRTAFAASAGQGTTPHSCWVSGRNMSHAMSAVAYPTSGDSVVHNNKVSFKDAAVCVIATKCRDRRWRWIKTGGKVSILKWALENRQVAQGSACKSGG